MARLFLLQLFRVGKAVPAGWGQARPPFPSPAKPIPGVAVVPSSTTND